jgi:toxin ParE1/3/4
VSKSLRTEQQASRELEEAARWYEERAPDLGTRFLSAVDASVQQITLYPQAGGPVPGVPTSLAVRRVSVPGFPYHVIYLELDDVIWILAFAHDRRKPLYWLSRADSHL